MSAKTTETASDALRDAVRHAKRARDLEERAREAWRLRDEALLMARREGTSNRAIADVDGLSPKGDKLSDEAVGKIFLRRTGSRTGAVDPASVLD